MTASELEQPSARDRQGDPGHDQATDHLVGIGLLRDRAAGMTYAQLAEAHGYATSSGARQALLRALDRHEAERANELRAIEHHAYLADQRVLRTIISDPNKPTAQRLRAIDTRTRSAARYARLMGLDAPVQVAISAGVQADLADALAELSEVLGDTVPGEVTAVTDMLLDQDEQEAAGE